MKLFWRKDPSFYGMMNVEESSDLVTEYPIHIVTEYGGVNQVS